VRFPLNPETLREYAAELRFRRRLKAENDARIAELTAWLEAMGGAA
jgi:hypothetical protein